MPTPTRSVLVTVSLGSVYVKSPRTGDVLGVLRCYCPTSILMKAMDVLDGDGMDHIDLTFAELTEFYTAWKQENSDELEVLELAQHDANRAEALSICRLLISRCETGL